MSLSKKETELFDDLRDIRIENFELRDFEGYPVICADHSEEQDGSDLEPLYLRLTPAEARKIKESLDADDDDGAKEDEEEEENRKPKRARWGG